MPAEVLLATRNAKKLAELRRILADRAARRRGRRARRRRRRTTTSPETGATFADNALIKAREAPRHTGLLTVADDSGLTVDALNGMPGVLSARWSGRHGDDEANLRLVLAQLADVPDDRLGRAFVCAAALVAPGQARQVVVEGRMPDGWCASRGVTTASATTRSSSPDGQTLTNAELPPARRTRSATAARRCGLSRRISFRQLGVRLISSLLGGAAASGSARTRSRPQ